MERWRVAAARHWFPRAAVLLFLLLMTPGLRASGTVDTCDPDNFEAALEAALSGGGTVTLRCPGTNLITRPKTISQDTRIEDTTGVGWISGAGSNRLFHILPGVRLTLVNVRLAGGRALGSAGRDGADGNDGGPGGDGFGGAVYNEGGTLAGIGLRFLNHQAVGGDGGMGADFTDAEDPSTQGGNGGMGHGGAIFSLGGTISLTNCALSGNLARGGRGGDGGSGSDFTRDGADGGHAGEGAGGAIFMAGDGSVRLSGCTFEDNSAAGTTGGQGGIGSGLIYFDGRNGNSSLGRGGAMAQEGGTAILETCLFDDNTATGTDGISGSLNALDRSEASGEDGLVGRGGALDMRLGSLEVVASTLFSSNRAAGGNGGDGGSTGGFGDGGDGGHGAAGQGGAVFLRGTGTALFLESTFSDNEVQAGFGGFGAFAASEVAFTGQDGRAGEGQGGGLYIDSAQVRIERCTFDANITTGGEGLEGAAGTAFVRGSPGTAGGAGRGGGLFSKSGTLDLVNSTFASNRAAGGSGGQGGNGARGGVFATDGGDGGRGGPAEGGGAWFGPAATASLNHCTFSTNTVVGGPGGTNGLAGDPELARPGNHGLSGAAAGGALGASASTVAVRNTLLAYSGLGGNVTTSVRDAGFNLCSDNSLPILETSTRTGLADLGLSPLANHGGPTRTVALLSESPAVDAGDALSPLPVDQRGLLRDPTPDIGAYEAGTITLPPLTIEIAADLVVISWPDLGVTYTLEATPTVVAPSWKGIGGATLDGGLWMHTNTTVTSQQYFRLRY